MNRKRLICAFTLIVLLSGPAVSAATGTATTSAAKAAPETKLVPPVDPVKTATAAKPAHQQSFTECVDKILGVLAEDGFGAGGIVSGTALGFDGKFHGLTTGAGIGVTHKWNADRMRFPVELGLYIVPELVIDGTAQIGAFAAVLHVAFLRGFGAGISCDLARVGDHPGFQAPSSHTCFLIGGFSPTNEAKRSAPAP